MSIFLLALSLFTQICICCNTVNSEVSFAESANQFQCAMLENDTLMIKGDHLRLSDFLTSEKFTASVPNNTLKKIYIFALDTIYIDKDLSAKGQELMIYMLAPKWFVNGTITFDLRGLNGEPFEKSAYGFDIHGKGKGGSPGKPGGPGGIFFGVYSEIVNSKFLTIDVGGGDGGKGQTGARGKKGKDGTRANFFVGSIMGSSEYDCSEDLCRNNILETKNEDGVLETFYCELQYRMEIDFFSSTRHCSIYVVGKEPKPAGEGGNGGQRGKGGFAGKITLLQLQSANTKFLTKNETGKDGEVGSGGAPGKAGRWGVQVKYSGKSIHGMEFFKTEWKQVYTKPDSRLAAAGKLGDDGGNDEKPPNPKPVHFPILEYKAINYFKSYLIDNLKYTNKYNTLKIFLNKLNDEDNINEFYSAIVLGEELLMVEDKRVFLSNDINFLNLYNSLKYRIINLAEKIKSHGVNQDNKLLSYITSATLSRIYNLKDYSESRLIIDVPAILDLVYNNFCDLEDLKNKENKLKIVAQKLNKINEHRNQYKKKLDEKIAAAEKIAEEFVEEIRKINDEIDETVQSLIAEIILLEVNEEKNQEILKEQKNALLGQLLFRGFFGIVGYAASFGSLLGPTGRVISGTVQSSTGVIESIALDSASTNVPDKDLEERIKHTNEMMKKMKKIEIERLHGILNNFVQEARGDKEFSDGLSEKVETIKKQLKSVKSFEDARKIENRFSIEIKKERMKLNNGTAGHKRAVKILDKFDKITKLATGAFNLYQSIDVEDVSAIDDALKESKLLFDKLKQLEIDVRNVLSPQLETMENTLNDIIEKLDKKSRVYLHVTKWTVHKLLESIAEQIHTFVGELKLEIDLSRRLEKVISNLKNTINVLIKVYDHIQNYEDDKYLYDYIADLTSAAAIDINITNLEYRKITNQLDVTISSNLILQQYEAAMNAFQQFVFPMADNYLKYFEFPPQLEMKYDLDDLVSKSKDQIKLLKNKLTEYQGAVLNEDKCITKGYFYNDHKITAPFYTWDGGKYEDTFIKMLSGEEVTIMADVVNSPASFDALKFTLIKLNFTSHNETLMKEIEEKLNFFEISMSHLGDSHYRLGNKYYRIDTDITEFSYSYKKELNGEPTFMSASYEKLKNGQLMLSPYALWRVKLRRYPTRRIREIFSHLNSSYTLIKRSIEYDDNASTGLEAFAKELIVEMVGKGAFVDTTKKDCNDFNVDKYYKPINITY